MKLNRLNLRMLAMLALATLVCNESTIKAGSGAGWGVAGGLVAGSMIASAANNNRNREVVYVNNGQPQHYSHKQQRRLQKEQQNLNLQQQELNRQRAELNHERARLNAEAARLGY